MRFVAPAGACATVLMALALVTACGTDAVGVSQCRTLERARCQAGAACGLVDDIDACVRFSRDHCLHGTATLTTPKATKVRDCESALTAAGQCAKDSRKTKASSCGIDLVASAVGATVCDVVTTPEKAAVCSFLLPDEESPPVSSPPPEDAGSDAGK